MREVIPLGTNGVLGGKFDIIRIAQRQGNAFNGAVDNFIFIHFKLKFTVQRRGGDKGMNALLFGGRNGFAAGVNIALITARERTNHRAINMPRDTLNGVKIPRRGGGKACLYDVCAHIRNLFSHAQFLPSGHGKSRGLLSVAQGGVEYFDIIFGHSFIFIWD